MKYSTAAAFRRALEQRIKDAAHHDVGTIARTRKRVAFDRLLARLAAVVPGDWAVKGGFALDLRLADLARTTQDIDLAWRGNAAELIDTFIKSSAHDVGDYFSFLIERTNDPSDQLGGTHRFRVNASLAGRPFETFLLDVGTLDGALTLVDSYSSPAPFSSTLTIFAERSTTSSIAATRIRHPPRCPRRQHPGASRSNASRQASAWRKVSPKLMPLRGHCSTRSYRTL